MAEEEAEEAPPRENIVNPIAELLRSDDDAQRVSGASQLKELASDPKNDEDILAANVAEPLVAMLASESESTRLAALKAMPGLVNRAGPVLRLQMGTADTVEALWRLIQSKTETTPPTEEAIAAAKEADEDPPEPVETVIPPPTPQLYYALRVLNAMVFADWQCTYFVIGMGGES